MSPEALSRIIQIRVSGKNKEKAGRYAQDLGKVCEDIRTSNPSMQKTIEVLGPIEASLQKVAKHYRWQILLKGVSSQSLHQLVHSLSLHPLYKTAKPDVQIVVDVDPFYMM